MFYFVNNCIVFFPHSKIISKLNMNIKKSLFGLVLEILILSLSVLVTNISTGKYIFRFKF